MCCCCPPSCPELPRFFKVFFRVTAYVFRFCHNLRIKSKQEPEAQGTYNGHLTANEIQDAEEY